jgi:hypothetical protein
MFDKGNKCREQASSGLANKNNHLQILRIFSAPGILQTAAHYANPENHFAIQPAFEICKGFAKEGRWTVKIGVG